MSEVDVNIVNAHKPNPATDIHTRKNNDGTYSIIIENLPFDFTDEFDGSWMLQEARDIMRKMSEGNKTYQQICQVVARSRD